MSWKYPKFPLKDTYVIDIDPINENFLSVVEETSSYLNEHNFKSWNSADLLFARADLPKDIGMRLIYSREEGTDPTNVDGTNWSRFTPLDFYQTKAKKGFSLNARFRGGKVWICGSFTLHTHPVPRTLYPHMNSDARSNSTNGKQKGFGFNVAIEVDGAIIGESLVGSGDLTIENNVNKSVVVDDSTAPVPITFFPVGGGGINGAMNSVVVDAVIDLSPGPHTIRIAIMDILASNGVAANRPTYVSTSELFALELTR